MTEEKLSHILMIILSLKDVEKAMLAVLLNSSEKRFSLLDLGRRLGLSYAETKTAKEHLQELNIIYCEQIATLELPQNRGRVNTMYQFFVNCNIDQWGTSPDV